LRGRGERASEKVAKILLVDDDAALLDVLALAFEDAGHDVLRAKDGLDALAAMKSARPELVVCDVTMPRLDGLSLCRQLREAKDAVPIVLLTSRDSEIDEALGLELGADDYVTKPFSTRVLLARVSALLRREQARANPGKPTLHAGALALDAERLRVTYQGSDVPVTVTEFRLLEVLAKRPGVVFSRAQLLELVRGDDSVVVDRIIDTYVRRVRRKLEAVDPTFAAIDTVVGAGYRWRENG
jgi:DNA-binding response OmpR family regulator